MKEVLLSGLLLLEGNDGKEYCEHSKNWALCHLPMEDIVHPELAVMPKGLPCFVCGKQIGRLLCSCVISVNVVGTWHA